MLREKALSEVQWPKLSPVHITTIIDSRQYMIRPEIEKTCIILYHEHAKIFIMYVFMKLLNHILVKMEYVLLSLMHIPDMKKAEINYQKLCALKYSTKLLCGDTDVMVLSP